MPSTASSSSQSSAIGTPVSADIERGLSDIDIDIEEEASIQDGWRSIIPYDGYAELLLAVGVVQVRAREVPGPQGVGKDAGVWSVCESWFCGVRERWLVPDPWTTRGRINDTNVEGLEVEGFLADVGTGGEGGDEVVHRCHRVHRGLWSWGRVRGYGIRRCSTVGLTNTKAGRQRQ
jgi:hypothetical protein